MVLTEKTRLRINQELNSYIKKNFSNLELLPHTLIPSKIDNVGMTEIGLCETDGDYTFNGKVRAVYATTEGEVTSNLRIEGKARIEEKQKKLEITILGNVYLQKE